MRELDSLLDLFTDLNSKVETLVKDKSELSSIPSIPSVRKICPEEGTFTLFQPQECLEIHAKADRMEKEIESLETELSLVREKLLKFDKRHLSDQDDIRRLSSLATSLKKALRLVAIDGDLLALKPFSLMADSPVEDSKFIQVMRLIIESRINSQSPPLITPNGNFSVSDTETTMEALPISPSSSRYKDSSKPQVNVYRKKSPVLVLQSSELREKIQQARMIVQGRPILLARN